MVQRLNAPVLVFLGPSAPESDVREVLPNAEIRPPVQRGDLHAARLLRYSVFIIIDGVFFQNDAISPREVVDVLEDGARVIGASSMGALRACDCWPAGAKGIGRIYRIFRRGIIGSEDEVAAVLNPLSGFPALNEPLANIRIAARAARRQGVISAASEVDIVAAAQAMPYAERSWASVLARSGCETSADWFARCDAKRRDARDACAYVARHIRSDPDWAERPRRSRSTFGVLAQPRSGRALDHQAPILPAESAPGFTLWTLLTGRANRYLRGPSAFEILQGLTGSVPKRWWVAPMAFDPPDVGQEIGRIHRELSSCADDLGELEAEQFRYLAFVRAASDLGEDPPAPEELSRAKARVAIGHRFANWSALSQSQSPEIVEMMKELIQSSARARGGP